jgi:hypothetical protein
MVTSTIDSSPYESVAAEHVMFHPRMVKTWQDLEDLSRVHQKGDLGARTGTPLSCEEVAVLPA